jgi:hypothetical protein
MDRREKILSELDLTKTIGIEIGPLCKPIVTKADGNILYVDHADMMSLRKKYADDPAVNAAEIVEIDAVWGKQTLQKCLKGEKVDYVIASHVIEHVPDMIAWLDEIDAVLRPGGSLRLVVPDRRFSFDYLRRESRLCDIANAYLLKARTPLPIAILDVFISTRQVDLQAAWHGTLPAELPMVPGHDFRGGMGVASDQIINGNYHDVHCWVFTPRSFAELFAEAAKEGLIRFACDLLYDTETNELEFVAILKPCTDIDRTIESWRRAAASVADLECSNRNNRVDADLQALTVKELDQLKRELASKEEELTTVKQTLEGVLTSKSWRLTEPLRSLRRAFQR